MDGLAAADSGIASPPHRALAAFTIGLAVMMSVLDSVMVNVALPSIARIFAASPSEAIWVVNANQLAVALVLLPLGRAADIIGHRRVYLASIALFTTASAGCALSGDLTSLAAWRFLQGCGGAGIVGMTNAMLRLTYPRDLLARGISINSLVVATSLASGPTIASAIVALANWQWLFLINIPFGALLLAVGLRFLPASSGSDDRYDFAGALLTMLTIGLLVVGLDTGAHGANPWLPVALVSAGLVMGIVLLSYQRGVAVPMFPMDLLRRRMFAMSVVTMFCAAMAQLMAYVSVPFFFQHELGRSQLETGLLFLPWPLAILLAAPLAGRFANRHPPAILCGLGLAVLAAGLLLLANLEAGASNWDIGWRMAVCGAGYGFFQPPSSRALILSAPIDRAGSGSVMGAFGRVLGQASGAALVAGVFRVFGDAPSQAALYAAASIALVAVAASLGRGLTKSTGET